MFVLRSVAGATAAPSPATAAQRCDLSTYVSSGTATSLLALDLKDCGLSSLPPSIAQFASLKKLDLGRNSLTDLPPLPVRRMAVCTVLRQASNSLLPLSPSARAGFARDPLLALQPLHLHAHIHLCAAQAADALV
jgi:hypothetical protein